MRPGGNGWQAAAHNVPRVRVGRSSMHSECRHRAHAWPGTQAALGDSAQLPAPAVCACLPHARRGVCAAPVPAHAPSAPPPPCAQIAMRVDEQCKVVCRISNLSKQQADAFKSKIDDEYKVYM